eukprot:4450304-Amphidinium_carterae.2
MSRTPPSRLSFSPPIHVLPPTQTLGGALRIMHRFAHGTSEAHVPVTILPKRLGDHKDTFQLILEETHVL